MSEDGSSKDHGAASQRGKVSWATLMQYADNQCGGGRRIQSEFGSLCRWELLWLNASGENEEKRKR